MIVDYASLKNFSLDDLDSARQWWVTIANSLTGQLADYQKTVMDPVNDDSAWTGTAATSGRAGVRRSHDKLVATQQYVDTAVRAVDNALRGMSAAQARLSEGTAIAANAGLTVDGAGNVHLAGGGIVDWDDPPVVAAMTAQAMIYQARYMAYTTDKNVCPILTSYAAKFGADDTGPWLTEAAQDQRTAQTWLAALPEQIDRIAVPDRGVPPDTPAQPYASEPATDIDRNLWLEMDAIVLPAFLVKGWTHAAAMLADWLGNTGATALVDPNEMLAAMPTFQSTVTGTFLGQGDGVTDSGWTNYQPQEPIESDDWYYAFNDVRYRVIALTMTDDNGIQHTEYTLGVKKPYVFGPPRKAISVHGIPVLEQWQLERLHLTGLAQNFVAQGISHATY